MTYGTVRKGRFEPKINYWLIPENQHVFGKKAKFTKYKGHSVCVAKEIDGQIRPVLVPPDSKHAVIFVSLQGNYYEAVKAPHESERND